MTRSTLSFFLFLPFFFFFFFAQVLEAAFPSPAEACLVDLSRPYVREDGALSGLAVVSHKAEGISHQSKFATTDGLAVGHVLFLPVSLQLPSLPTTALHVSTIRSLPPAFVSRFVWSGGVDVSAFLSLTHKLSLTLSHSLTLSPFTLCKGAARNHSRATLCDSRVPATRSGEQALLLGN